MFICSSYTTHIFSPLLPAANRTFIPPYFLPTVSLFLACFSFFHLTSISYCPTIFLRFPPPLQFFLHFDFPQISITIHQVCSFRLSSVEMSTHSELCFYNFPNSIFNFLTSFSVQGLAMPSHFLSTAIFVVLFFSPLSTSPSLRLFSITFFFLSYLPSSCFPSHKEHSIFC